MAIIDINKMASAIAEHEKDFNKTATGGGEREVAPKGLARLRFVGYVETGKHEKKGKFAGKVEDVALWLFELSGKKYKPREVEIDGETVTIPFRITVRTNKSQHEKATYSKLFKRMNHEGKATHPSQLLGQAFLGTVGHYTFKGSDGEDVTIANFRDDTGALTIRPPFIEQMDDEGEIVLKKVKVQEPTEDIKLFVWNASDFMQDMWASIKLSGDKQYFHDEIKRAMNFEGSPVADWLESQGMDLGIPDADTPDDIDEENEEEEKPKAKKKAKKEESGHDPLDDLDLDDEDFDEE